MDLIILIVIAVILVLKLKNQLGNVDKEERDEAIIKRFLNKRNCCCTPAATCEKEQDIVEVKEVFPVKDSAQEQENAEANQVEDYTKYILSNATEELTDTLQQIAQMFKEVGFTAAGFINSSKKVYEMTIGSYADGDLEGLQELVSPEVYTVLAQKIENRKQLNHTLHNSIIRIKEAKFYRATIESNRAILGVAFLSEQINFVENEQHEVIKGNKNDIVSLADYWLFSKQQDSKDKGWTVINIADSVSPKIIQGVIHSMKVDVSTKPESSEIGKFKENVSEGKTKANKNQTVKSQLTNSATDNKITRAATKSVTGSKGSNLTAIKSKVTQKATKVAQKASKAVSVLTGNKRNNSGSKKGSK